jgi:hypothetical protein
MWAKIVKFFHDSEVIFMARLEAISGFVVTALAAINWDQLFSMSSLPSFTWNQAATVGAIMLVQGVVLEWARRRREPDMQKITLP